MATAAPRTDKRKRRESMSRVDTAWLRMERTTNPMMITGMLMFDEPMAMDRLKRVVKRRLEHVAECMNQLKNSRQAIVAFGLLAALGMAPSAMQGVALELFSRKATAVATNVPGPQQPLYLAGCMLREMMFWVPQAGSIGIGISILSYNGRRSPADSALSSRICCT